MSSQRHSDQSMLTNHWTSRPEWSGGRSLLACYLTLGGIRQVVERIAVYQHRLLDLTQVDLVRPEWLHVTVQGIAFTDELSVNGAERLAKALTDPLAAMPAPRLRLERPEVGSDGVFLPLEPAAELTILRAAVRTAAKLELDLPQLYALPGQTLGDDLDLSAATHPDLSAATASDRNPGRRRSFHPHTSLAYVNRDLPRAEILDRLDPVPYLPVEFTLRSVSVIKLHRSDHTWWWSDRWEVPLGTAIQPGAVQPGTVQPGTVSPG